MRTSVGIMSGMTIRCRADSEGIVTTSQSLTRPNDVSGAIPERFRSSRYILGLTRDYDRLIISKPILRWKGHGCDRADHGHMRRDDAQVSAPVGSHCD